MSKQDQIMLFVAIEEVRNQLKKSNSKLELAEIHERLVALYQCIDTESAIDALAQINNNRGIA